MVEPEQVADLLAKYTIVTDWNPITMRYEGKDYFNGVETGSFVCFTKTPPGNTPFMFGECISASCPFVQQTCDGVQAARSFLYCGAYCGVSIWTDTTKLAAVI